MLPHIFFYNYLGLRTDQRYCLLKLFMIKYAISQKSYIEEHYWNQSLWKIGSKIHINNFKFFPQFEKFSDLTVKKFRRIHIIGYTWSALCEIIDIYINDFNPTINIIQLMWLQVSVIYSKRLAEVWTQKTTTIPTKFDYASWGSETLKTFSNGSII